MPEPHLTIQVPVPPCWCCGYAQRPVEVTIDRALLAESSEKKADSNDLPEPTQATASETPFEGYCSCPGVGTPEREVYAPDCGMSAHREAARAQRAARLVDGDPNG